MSHLFLLLISVYLLSAELFKSFSFCAYLLLKYLIPKKIITIINKNT